MNTTTPRLFIAATRQNEGKTTTSLGLLAAIQKFHPRVGYIKPVGQRFVEIAEQKIDEDTVLMDRVYQLNCPLVDMSPIAVEPDFTRKYLESSNSDALVNKLHPDRIGYIADFARRGLKRKGLKLLGIMPHQPILSKPTMEGIRDELGAEELNQSEQISNLVKEVVVGAMGVQNAMSFFKPG